MITIVTWLWNNGFRRYEENHVRVLASMFRRCLQLPHQLICLTDDYPAGKRDGVWYMPTPAAAAALAHVPTPEGGRFPACYRRLWMFSVAAAELGNRLLLVDIDLVLTGDCTRLLDRRESFVGWRPKLSWGQATRLGGGIYLLDAGARTRVWTEFSAARSPTIARAAGYRGSDQAWISYCLAATETAYWTKADGLYSIRDLRNGLEPLPDHARLVQFNGGTKPWSSSLSWVKNNWI